MSVSHFGHIMLTRFIDDTQPNETVGIIGVGGLGKLIPSNA